MFNSFGGVCGELPGSVLTEKRELLCSIDKALKITGLFRGECRGELIVHGVLVSGKSPPPAHDGRRMIRVLELELVTEFNGNLLDIAECAGAISLKVGKLCECGEVRSDFLHKHEISFVAVGT